ncbi:MAG: c-type cytochrome, partial [Planctomycetes bacterium]|nr:c-type cytochrome [Planctomycetota bacterium]
MRSSCLCVAVASAMMIAILPAKKAEAALTAKHRKELSKIRRDLAKVSSLIRRKKYEEAKKIIDDAEQRYSKIIKEAKLPARSRIVTGAKRSIQLKRIQLGRAQGKSPAQTVSVDFNKQVAPILRQRCARCHTANARGGLRIDQTASLSRVIVAGNARGSKLIQRIVATGNQRMPKGGQPLSQAEKNTLVQWINQGAKFSANSVAGKTPAKKTPEPKAKIAKATGKETVSFTKDIAPFMVNLCVRCHNDRAKRGGLSLVTFEKMMQGGKSGRVILAGNIDGSRMWDLVGKQKPIKMPQGQARITRTN